MFTDITWFTLLCLAINMYTLYNAWIDFQNRKNESSIIRAVLMFATIHTGLCVWEVLAILYFYMRLW